MAKLNFKNIKGISFDLDDTLYDNKPVIKNAFLTLYNYLTEHYPNIKQHYNFQSFVDAAITLKDEHPLITNMNTLRKLHISKTITVSGYPETNDLHAYEIFWKARQKVTLFPETIKVLRFLSKKVPLVSISNGNACTKSIGIDAYFQYNINAMDTGKIKPDSSMFHLACNKLSIKHEQLLHIGDDLSHDIKGAFGAGCRSIWINRHHQICHDHSADAVIEKISDLLHLSINNMT